ncbi:hypothetical protein ruthe_01866 [Rubellimicrobium thermophilum DSM 16684]|uniref:DUF4177 domain-containing protein n=1 Tax=Rubellimicrobium thermophilum DSM 16684 TaxID=1123069 RepID=S9SF03_9RHOB|nr:hypothetical protein [Rubellimicrobium thermophilum]EPX84869.1 hypothetical protein ruthe_01866 [Rubellimicrobium thermophilum DSM 16684]
MRLLPAALLLLIALPLEAAAACYADYKASRRDPFELHYGVAEIFGPCDTASAAEELAPRLAADGWHLLEVDSTFDETGLEARRESAGDYYLRY